LAVTITAQERPPQILLIHRDGLKPGIEATYRAIEEDAARICADLKCPHPHFALESLTGPKEVWWLNALDSETDKQRVIDAYKSNRPLSEALAAITKRREGLLTTDVEFFVGYRPDSSRSGTWKVAGVRFFAVTVTRKDPPKAGAAFQAPDGSWFVFRALKARDEVGAMAASVNPDTTIFAVRPYWGLPAKEWIDADPDFWKANPSVTAK
jgi:hypothetical protein